MQRAWMQQEDKYSPTVYKEIILLVSVVDPKKDGDVATIYIPNFFIQNPINNKPGEGKNVTKIKGVLVDMLVQMCHMLNNVTYTYYNNLLAGGSQ